MTTPTLRGTQRLLRLHDWTQPYAIGAADCAFCARVSAEEAAMVAAEEAAERDGTPYPQHDWDAWLDRYEEDRRLCGELHRVIERALPADDEYRARYVAPAAHVVDGRTEYAEPIECGGVTERSVAFLLLNRHRLGTVIAAPMGDYARRTAAVEEAGGAAITLRLFDDAGRSLGFRGFTAGYGGEGPHGTVWALRMTGFADSKPKSGRASALERLVFGNDAFLTRRVNDAGDWQRVH